MIGSYNSLDNTKQVVALIDEVRMTIEFKIITDNSFKITG